MKKIKYIQNEYEIKHGLVSRTELIKNVTGMFLELDDSNFHRLYMILWTLTADMRLQKSSDMLLKWKDEEITDLKKQLAQLNEVSQ